MSWDVTQDVGHDMCMDRTSGAIMVDGDWTLEKVYWSEVREDGIIWANHHGCRDDNEGRYGRFVPGLNRYGQWFPRDNALAGFCCYCGDPVPEHFITLFKMYNWDEISNWGQGIK